MNEKTVNQIWSDVKQLVKNTPDITKEKIVNSLSKDHKSFAKDDNYLTEIDRVLYSIGKSDTLSIAKKHSKSALRSIRFGAKKLRDNPPKPVEFLVEGLIPKVGYSVLAAPGGIGKSYYALQLGASLSSGYRFLGEFEIPKKRRTLIINTEDSETIYASRMTCVVDNLMAQELLPRNEIIDAIDDMQMVSLNQMMEHEELKNITPTIYSSPDFIDLIKEIALDMGGIDLLILDPLNQLVPADTSDNQVASEVVTSLNKLSRELDAMIILVNHVTKSATSGSKMANMSEDVTASRGASTFTDSARLVLSLSRPTGQMTKGTLAAYDPENLILHGMPKCNVLHRKDTGFIIRREDNGILSYFNQQGTTPDASFKLSPLALITKRLIGLKNKGITKAEVTKILDVAKNTARKRINELLADGNLIMDENSKLVIPADKYEGLMNDDIQNT